MEQIDKKQRALFGDMRKNLPYVADHVKLQKVAKKVKKLTKISKDDYGYVNNSLTRTVNGVSDAAVQMQGFIVQGDGSGNRTGDVIQPVDATLSYTLLMPPAQVVDICRVICVRVKNFFGSVPAASTVLTSATIGTYYNSDYNDLQVRQRNSPASTGTFEIIYDRKHILTANSPMIKVKKYFKLVNKSPISYTASAGNNADLSKGGMWIFVLSTGITTVFNGNCHFKWTG